MQKLEMIDGFGRKVRAPAFVLSHRQENPPREPLGGWNYICLYALWDAFDSAFIESWANSSERFWGTLPASRDGCSHHSWLRVQRPARLSITDVTLYQVLELSLKLSSYWSGPSLRQMDHLGRSSPLLSRFNSHCSFSAFHTYEGFCEDLARQTTVTHLSHLQVGSRRCRTLVLCCHMGFSHRCGVLKVSI